jgi:hypothetical protein
MIRAALCVALVASCSASPVATDSQIADRAVDQPPLTWRDLGPDRHPWPEARPPEARPPEARVDVRIDQRVTDLVPLGYCQDGTPMFQCSSQKPYLCNAVKLLEHKCSKCGCPGNEVCVPATEGCQPVKVVLQPTADATVSSGSPTANYGGSPSLGVGAGSLFYIDFDVSKVPPKAKIDNATLTLNQTIVLVSASILLNQVTDPWAEALITYSTAPQVQPVPQASASIGSAGLYNIDVTSLIQAWVNSPAVLHGMRVTASSGMAGFSSRETGAKAPTLTVTYR